MIDEALFDQIKPGAVVKVTERIKDGEKERVSNFQGIIIARKHGKEAGARFTVRAVIDEIGVEKVYPLHSPMIAKVQIISAPKKPKRSKLYFIRDLSKKKIRQKLNV